jgi:uncharacterized protein (DUF952 family)
VTRRASEESGAFTGSPVDVRDGFIHFSTAEQVRETAARHFAGVDNLLLVAVSAHQRGQSRQETSRDFVERLRLRWQAACSSSRP